MIQGSAEAASIRTDNSADQSNPPPAQPHQAATSFHGHNISKAVQERITEPRGLKAAKERPLQTLVDRVRDEFHNEGLGFRSVTLFSKSNRSSSRTKTETQYMMEDPSPRPVTWVHAGLAAIPMMDECDHAYLLSLKQTDSILFFKRDAWTEYSMDPDDREARHRVKSIPGADLFKEKIHELSSRLYSSHYNSHGHLLQIKDGQPVFTRGNAKIAQPGKIGLSLPFNEIILSGYDASDILAHALMANMPLFRSGRHKKNPVSWGQFLETIQTLDVRSLPVAVYNSLSGHIETVQYLDELTSGNSQQAIRLLDKLDSFITEASYNSNSINHMLLQVGSVVLLKWLTAQETDQLFTQQNSSPFACDRIKNILQDLFSRNKTYYCNASSRQEVVEVVFRHYRTLHPNQIESTDFTQPYFSAPHRHWHGIDHICRCHVIARACIDKLRDCNSYKTMVVEYPDIDELLLLAILAHDLVAEVEDKQKEESHAASTLKILCKGHFQENALNLVCSALHNKNVNDSSCPQPENAKPDSQCNSSELLCRFILRFADQADVSRVMAIGSKFPQALTEQESIHKEPFFDPNRVYIPECLHNELPELKEYLNTILESAIDLAALTGGITKDNRLDHVRITYDSRLNNEPFQNAQRIKYHLRHDPIEQMNQEVDDLCRRYIVTMAGAEEYLNDAYLRSKVKLPESLDTSQKLVLCKNIKLLPKSIQVQVSDRIEQLRQAPRFFHPGTLSQAQLQDKDISQYLKEQGYRIEGKDILIDGKYKPYYYLYLPDQAHFMPKEHDDDACSIVLEDTLLDDLVPMTLDEEDSSDLKTNHIKSGDLSSDLETNHIESGDLVSPVEESGVTVFSPPHQSADSEDVLTGTNKATATRSAPVFSPLGFIPRDI